MYKNIPKLKITIDEEYSDGEDLGLSMIAFTKRPAIMVKGMAFNSQTKIQYFKDDLKYRICAPAMIPMEIYRNDDDGEYTVTFTSDEIEKIYSKFMMNYSSTKIFNLEHNPTEVVPAYILESWIVDNPKLDKSFTTFGIEVPVGTLMVTSQITDVDYYNELVKNGQVGYSIEGYLGMKLSEIKMATTPPFHPNCKCELIGGTVIPDLGVCDYCLEQINKLNLTEEKMKLENFNLPAGEYTDKDGNIFIVDENGVSTPKTELELETTEVPAGDVSGNTETSTETKLEEVVEETEVEMAVGDVPVEVPAETYTKEEVDEKFNELYKLIGDMQAEDDSEDILEPVEPMEMNIHNRFSAFVEFSKNNNI